MEIAKWLSQSEEDPCRANLRMLGLALYRAADAAGDRKVAASFEAAGDACWDAVKGRISAEAALEAARNCLDGGKHGT